MKVELNPSESVTVTFAESDGEIKVAFCETAIRVEADLPDTEGREGIIYEEIFQTPPDSDIDLKPAAEEPTSSRPALELVSKEVQTLMDHLNREVRSSAFSMKDNLVKIQTGLSLACQTSECFEMVKRHNGVRVNGYTRPEDLLKLRESVVDGEYIVIHPNDMLKLLREAMKKVNTL